MYNQLPDILLNTTIEDRREIASNFVRKYPDRVPCLVYKAPTRNSDDVPELNRSRYLVPRDTTVAYFIIVLRKLLFIRAEQSLFLFFDNKLYPNTTTFDEIYRICTLSHSSDKFIHIQYAMENTFG